MSVRKAGQWCYYSLAPAEAPFHEKLLECLGCCFAEVREIQTDARRAAKLRGKGCCPDEVKAEPLPVASSCECTPSAAV